VKKLIIAFLVSLQLCGVALAEEVVNEASPTSVFKEVNTEELQQPQTVQFFLGAPSSELPAKQTLDAEFLYQKLLDRMNSDFLVVDSIMKIFMVLVALSAIFLIIALTTVYFVFYKKLKKRVHKFEKIAKEKTEEIKKECEMQSHNVQSIVDSQQQVLNELKAEAEKVFLKNN